MSALQASGAKSPTAVPVGFSISSTNIRFYHAEDSAAAAKVAEVLRAEGQETELRDFTDFRPQPDLGLVEVWLAGDGGATPARQSARATPARQSPAASSAVRQQ